MPTVIIERKKIHHLYIWAVPFTNIILNMMPISPFNTGANLMVALFAVVIPIIFWFLDRDFIRSAGYQVPRWGWIFLMPIYVWKRDTLIGKGRAGFIGYIILFLLAVFLRAVQSTYDLDY